MNSVILSESRFWMRFDACLNLATGQAVGRDVDDVIATLICIPDISGRFAQMSPKQHLQVISSDQVPLGSYAWPKSRRPYDFHAKSRLARSAPTIPVLERD